MPGAGSAGCKDLVRCKQHFIEEVKSGKGSDAGWGRLKSGAGFIALDYAKRV